MNKTYIVDNETFIYEASNNEVTNITLVESIPTIVFLNKIQ